MLQDLSMYLYHNKTLPWVFSSETTFLQNTSGWLLLEVGSERNHVRNVVKNSLRKLSRFISLKDENIVNEYI